MCGVLLPSPLYVFTELHSSENTLPSLEPYWQRLILYLSPGSHMFENLPALYFCSLVRFEVFTAVKKLILGILRSDAV